MWRFAKLPSKNKSKRQWAKKFRLLTQEHTKYAKFFLYLVMGEVVNMPTYQIPSSASFKKRQTGFKKDTDTIIFSEILKNLHNKIILNINVIYSLFDDFKTKISK